MAAWEEGRCNLAELQAFDRERREEEALCEEEALPVPNPNGEEEALPVPNPKGEQPQPQAAMCPKGDQPPGPPPLPPPMPERLPPGPPGPPSSPPPEAVPQPPLPWAKPLPPPPPKDAPLPWAESPPPPPPKGAPLPWAKPAPKPRPPLSGAAAQSVGAVCSAAAPGVPPPRPALQLLDLMQGDVPNPVDQRSQAHAWWMPEYQQIHPDDLTKDRRQRWRWVGNCWGCRVIEHSDWGIGHVPRPPGWSAKMNWCPTCTGNHAEQQQQPPAAAAASSSQQQQQPPAPPADGLGPLQLADRDD